MTDEINVAPGVSLRDCDWGCYLTGSKDALLGARLARSEWFPAGERDSAGRTIRMKKTKHEGRQILCRERRNGTYFVGIHFLAEDPAVRTLLDRIAEAGGGHT